jgi:hypothetical protein
MSHPSRGRRNVEPASVFKIDWIFIKKGQFKKDSGERPQRKKNPLELSQGKVRIIPFMPPINTKPHSHFEERGFNNLSIASPLEKCLKLGC